MLRTICLLACLFTVHGASAEVIAGGSNGFSLRIETDIKASAEQSYQAFVDMGSWWDMDHSYTGKRENFSLELKPGGGFIETLDNGGFVRHLELVYLEPGVEIRFLGGLGPLQTLGVDGTLTVRFKPTDTGSKTIMIYNVSGFSGQGLGSLSPLVDRVQAGQMAAHAAYAERLAAEGQP